MNTTRDLYVKFNFKVVLMLLAFFLYSCSITFHVASPPVEGPNVESKLPTDSFLKFETWFVEDQLEGDPIENIVSVCSGFSVGHTKAGTVGITNNHCVEPNPFIIISLLLNERLKVSHRIKTSDNERYEIKVLQTDKKADLASFLVPNKHIPASRVSHREPEVGETVWIVGSPLGFETIRDELNTVPIISGIYNGLVKTARLGDTIGYLFSARLAGGSSGSGVYIRTGNTYEVVSVIHSGILLDESKFQDFSISTNRDDFVRFVNKHNLN